MGTAFSVIRDYIRAAVRDYDSEAYIYSNEALDSQVRLTILGDADYNESPSGSFDADLTGKQKLAIALKTAIRLLNGTPRNFSYKSPVMSVTRSGGVAELVATLESMLDDSEGGRFAISTDTDFNALVQGFDRYVNGIDSAFNAWSGTASPNP